VGPLGAPLAGCSDNSTAKVWDVSWNSNQPLHDFKSHKQKNLLSKMGVSFLGE